MEKVTIDEAALKARVGDLAYDVLRNAATERPFTGEYTDTELVGSYRCKACNAELFKSETKFHSGCGWPSFYAPSSDDAVTLIEDRSLAPRIRTEVRCAACDSHLGHIFKGEGYDVPTDERYEDWVLDDPAGQGIEPVRVIRDEIKKRVEALLAELLA